MIKRDIKRLLLSTWEIDVNQRIEQRKSKKGRWEDEPCKLSFEKMDTPDGPAEDMRMELTKPPIVERMPLTRRERSRMPIVFAVAAIISLDPAFRL